MSLNIKASVFGLGVGPATTLALSYRLLMITQGLPSSAQRVTPGVLHTCVCMVTAPCTMLSSCLESEHEI